MATPAQTTPLRLVASAAAARETGPAEPVPVAFLGRTSTLEMQDPRASLNRQIRAARAWLPPGWFITAWYWDIESGGLDLEQRGRGTAHQAFTGAGIPRDGGHGRPARRGRQPRPEVRRGGLRGHRAVRPGHLQRAETGKEAVPARDRAVRHRRARRHRGRQRHHGAGPADEAGRGRMVPAAAEGENLERAGRARPGRVEHRPRPLRVPRRPDPAPRPGQSLPGPDQDPAGPGPGPRPGGGADLHLAGGAQARHAHHRRPAQRRPGPLPRPHRERVDHPDRLRRARQPEVHRAHGLRPDPQPPRPPRHRPPVRMAVVTRAGPPRHRATGTPGPPPSRSARSIRPAGTATR